jgi:hypothetical protein
MPSLCLKPWIYLWISDLAKSAWRGRSISEPMNITAQAVKPRAGNAGSFGMASTVTQPWRDPIEFARSTVVYGDRRSRRECR